MSLSGPDPIRRALSRQFSLAGGRRSPTDAIRVVWKEVSTTFWAACGGHYGKGLWPFPAAERGSRPTARRRMRTSVLRWQGDELFQSAWKKALSQDKNHNPGHTLISACDDLSRGPIQATVDLWPTELGANKWLWSEVTRFAFIFLCSNKKLVREMKSSPLGHRSIECTCLCIPPRNSELL